MYSVCVCVCVHMLGMFVHVLCVCMCCTISLCVYLCVYAFHGAKKLIERCVIYKPLVWRTGMLYVRIERDDPVCLQWLLMKWHNAEHLGTELFLENILNNREILPDIIIFVMCKAFH